MNLEPNLADRVDLDDALVLHTFDPTQVIDEQALVLLAHLGYDLFGTHADEVWHRCVEDIDQFVWEDCDVSLHPSNWTEEIR